MQMQMHPFALVPLIFLFQLLFVGKFVGKFVKINLNKVYEVSVLLNNRSIRCDSDRRRVSCEHRLPDATRCEALVRNRRPPARQTSLHRASMVDRRT